MLSSKKVGNGLRVPRSDEFQSYLVANDERIGGRACIDDSDTTRPLSAHVCNLSANRTSASIFATPYRYSDEP